MDFDAIEAALGHTFKDHDALRRALTHGSFAGGRTAANETYQRLEFLGDRVLALVIANALIARFPGADEGELARRLNHLVRTESCAHVARTLGFHEHVRSEGLSLGADTRAAQAVLADVCEALIAALYLDGGIAACERFILANWQPLMEADAAGRRDPKTALQEWAHQKGKQAPSYQEIGRSGPDHAPVFEIEVEVAGIAPLSMQGKSKRDAQQAAAQALLVREGVWEADR
ncbi:MAG: ribonuclease III [Devosiaceae bacterium]|nr:ribonuclease III [Devosiaceae bacterium MH13]